MAKHERSFKGDFIDFLSWIDKSIKSGSVSASYEDRSDINTGDAKLAVRVYERYSMSITVLNHNDRIHISAITSGGSKAVFLKINTFGESAFLEGFIAAVEKYIINNSNG